MPGGGAFVGRIGELAAMGAELDRVRIHHLTAGERHVTVTTRRSPLQAAILAALDVDTHTWDNATIT